MFQPGIYCIPTGRLSIISEKAKTGAGMTFRITDKMTRIQSPEMDEGGKKNSALSRGAVNELPEYDSLPAGGTIISGLTDEEG